MQSMLTCMQAFSVPIKKVRATSARRKLIITNDTQSKDPYKLLQIERGSTKFEIRQAYVTQMKRLHPDVNPDTDTTQLAISINKAYKELMSQQIDINDKSGPIGDVFDETVGEVEMIFINPFACFGVDPMRWRELQGLVGGKEMSMGMDIDSVLQSYGINFQGGAINYLTQEQYEEVWREMGLMEKSLSFETTAWYLGDCLSRAYRVNNMMS
eukprot:TRINITY_DN13996_c0_g1_i2.p2 TRINITY_DN13996_c0_g1~~TRINITY_DN13996_c0_g1_i2.p2  ORF type:complete len:212 (-),score=23.91 TRINITY_DN13996_c0_g1_i2:102-737(-)